MSLARGKPEKNGKLKRSSSKR